MDDASENWFSPEATTFGDRLAGAREQAGMSQEDLAKRLGVKISSLRGWENDLNEPRANKLSMLAGLLNVSLSWLLNGEGDGIDGPEADPLPDDLNALLIEVRHLKGQMLSTADRLGIVEKRLRETMKAQNG